MATASSSGLLCRQFKNRGKALNVSFIVNETSQHRPCIDAAAVVVPVNTKRVPTGQPTGQPSFLPTFKTLSPSIIQSLSTNRSLGLLAVVLLVGLIRFSPLVTAYTSKKEKPKACHLYDILVILSEEEEAVMENIRHDDIMYFEEVSKGNTPPVWMMNSSPQILMKGVQVQFTDRHALLPSRQVGDDTYGHDNREMIELKGKGNSKDRALKAKATSHKTNNLSILELGTIVNVRYAKDTNDEDQPVTALNNGKSRPRKVKQIAVQSVGHKERRVVPLLKLPLPVLSPEYQNPPHMDLILSSFPKAGWDDTYEREEGRDAEISFDDGSYCLGLTQESQEIEEKRRRKREKLFALQDESARTSADYLSSMQGDRSLDIELLTFNITPPNLSPIGLKTPPHITNSRPDKHNHNHISRTFLNTQHSDGSDISSYGCEGDEDEDSEVGDSEKGAGGRNKKLDHRSIAEIRQSTVISNLSDSFCISDVGSSCRVSHNSSGMVSLGSDSADEDSAKNSLRVNGSGQGKGSGLGQGPTCKKTEDTYYTVRVCAALYCILKYCIVFPHMLFLTHLSLPPCFPPPLPSLSSFPLYAVLDVDDIDAESGCGSEKRTQSRSKIAPSDQPMRLGWRCFSPNSNTASTAGKNNAILNIQSVDDGSRCSSPLFCPSLFGSEMGDPHRKRELEREFGINDTQTCIYDAELGSDSAGEGGKQGDVGSFTPGRLKVKAKEVKKDIYEEKEDKKSAGKGKGAPRGTAVAAVGAGKDVRPAVNIKGKKPFSLPNPRPEPPTFEGFEKRRRSGDRLL
jgi:hypothetical protein